MKPDTIAKKLNQAGRLFAAGDLTAALTAYKQLLQKQPKDPRVLMDYGRISLAFGDLNAAGRSFRTLGTLYPSDPGLLLDIGHTYESFRFPDLAHQYFQAAAAADSEAVNPRISLALLHEKARRPEAAREAIQECLRIAPNDEQARYVSAFLDFREEKLEAAETQMRDLIASGPRHEYVWYASRYILAEILDRTHRFDEAMRNLAEAKDFIRNLPYSVALNETRSDEWNKATEELRQLPRNFFPTAANKFPERDRCKIPPFAFLGGNPRSGTTLLEQILASHPGIVAADEPEVVPLAQTAMRPGVTISQLNAARRRYIGFIEKMTGPVGDGRLLLEKNPGATQALPDLLRLFPELRVLIALRDPRDVVLSLYFQNIPLNHARFFTLEDFARSYGALMGIWLAVREWEGFSWIETRYEDMVSDMEKEGRRVTAFLGLAWHEKQALYFAAAGKRRIYAPTYHDVTKPIYSRAVGRWRNYEKYFEPILPILEPYCRAFGYS